MPTRRVACGPLLACLLAWCASSASAQPTRHALVIGIAGYPNFEEGSRLHYADDDAQHFKDFILTEAGGGFPAANVVILRNQEATRDRIIREISRLQRITSDRDIVYIFFSGHASRDALSLHVFLMPYDADPKVPDSLGIPIEDFRRKIESIQGKIVLFLDACHAGSVYNEGFEKNGSQSPSAEVAANLAALQRERPGGLLAFLSASANEYSHEDPDKKMGIFTWYLIRALRREADGVGGASKDGLITAGEVFRYLYDNVPAHAKARLGKSQSPYRSPIWDADFPLARYPPPPVRSDPPKSASGTTSKAEAPSRGALVIDVHDNLDLQAVNDQLRGRGFAADIYFEPDSAGLSNSARESLNRSAALLKEYSLFLVTIEGHAAQAGSNEYNLALGDRRANMVRDYLIAQGVPGNRLRTVSFGEERPVCLESTVNCSDQNQRAHLVITGSVGR